MLCDVAASTGADGDRIDLDITGVAHGGVFVGRHEGRVVFVPDAIPGERVRVRLTDAEPDAEADRRRFWRAEALEILDASSHRRVHVWRQADIDVSPEDRPGGADFGHIALDHQRSLKLQVVTEALQRIGGLDIPVSIAPAPDETPDGTRWRTRVSLHVDEDGRVGPFAARSHRVIEVADHPLATEAVERAALRLTSAKPGRIDLVQPSDGRVRVIPRPDARARRRPEHDAAAREVVLERVGGREFRVDAGGFWQVHRSAAQALSALVAARLDATADAASVDPDAWNLDLYGGVGLFAATLASLGGARTKVTSVESDPRATDHAGENLAEWVGARAETARVDRWLARTRAAASAYDRDRLSRGVVVLDPPRSGAGRDVVRSVADLQPARVVYVACDPVALARDLATFREAGYETDRVDALDLFPNSHHVEAVAVLTRESSER